VHRNHNAPVVSVKLYGDLGCLPKWNDVVYEIYVYYRLLFYFYRYMEAQHLYSPLTGSMHSIDRKTTTDRICLTNKYSLMNNMR